MGNQLNISPVVQASDGRQALTQAHSSCGRLGKQCTHPWVNDLAPGTDMDGH